MRSKLADMLYENARTMPDKTAIWCDGRELTYRGMADLVSRYSNLLLDCGAAYGDHVAIPMNNSIESAALFFSAADLGLCVVPLNPTLPVRSIQTAMASGDMKHLIARKAFLSECARSGGIDVPGFTVCLDGEWEGAVPFARTEEMSSDRPAIGWDVTGSESLILTMTSGSTGSPKPIDISQNNKVDRSFAHIERFGLTKEDRVLAATPLYHSLAERLVIMPMILGATAILLPRFTPALWLQCAEQQRPTFTIAVSAQLAQILELLEQPGAPAIDSFRAIVSSSALLEEGVKKELIKKLNCEFHETYGTSEIATATSICFQREPHKQKSVGRPFKGVEVRILREDDDDALPGEVGEIACRTPMFCKGYYKLDTVMAVSMFEGFFRTGDLGYLDEDGYLYFAGRKKELIITGAVNVYPHDIDAVVSEIPEVEECAAFSYPDDRLGEVVALAVVPREDAELKVRTIKTYCARHLADFQQPHKIFLVDKLPKNALGKLQRMNILPYIRQAGLDEA